MNKKKREEIGEMTQRLRAQAVEPAVVAHAFDLYEFQDNQGYTEKLSKTKQNRQMRKSTGCSSGEPGSIPSTHTITDICNSSSRGSDAMLWALWTPDMHGVHRHTCRLNTHMQALNVPHILGEG